jgi:L-ascorbate metabolism protein UlaG (beta-lactamase superfamily)
MSRTESGIWAGAWHGRECAAAIGLMVLSAACAPASEAPSKDVASEAIAEPGIEIEYIAHASFLLRAPDGTELLIDPFASRVWLGYDWPEGIDPDGILITHPHYDHDAGRYRVMPFPWAADVPVMDSPGSQTFGDFTVTGVEGKHADPYGMEFGQLNTVMVIEAAGMRVAHFGDNGPLTADMIAGIGPVDVLLLPGDGVYHIISEETTQAVLAALSPKIVIPMHYRLGDLEIEADDPSDLGDVDPWLEGRERVERVGGNVTTLREGELPTELTFLLFEHAPYVTAPSGPGNS